MARPSRTGGKTSEAKARSTSPAKGRKTTKTKPRIAPATTQAKRRPVSGPSKDLKEAREQQAATAEILKVIARSPSDVQPVFDAIAARSNQLVGGLSATVTAIADEMLHLRAFTPVNPEADAALKSMFPFPLSEFPWREVILRGVTFAMTDIAAADPLPPLAVREMARLRGYRSILFVPLMRDGKTTGMISVTRVRPGAFADHHVKLLRTFADQAVIAIENTRLFNETREALERQTATADILKVIASSPDDVQPVFDAIAESAKRLIGGFAAGVYRFVNEVVHLATFTSVNPAADEAFRATFPRPIADVEHFRIVHETGAVFPIPDTEDQPDVSLKEVTRARGVRSLLLVPLKSNGTPIGTIAVSRTNPGPFSAHHVQLLQAFADQAVIAIENVRLFNETQEALERQTATADVLDVISRSPTDAVPVFDFIGERAEKLCNAEISVISVLDGDVIKLAGIRGIAKSSVELFRAHFPMPLDRMTVTAQTINTGAVVHISDVLVDTTYDNRTLAEQTGYRSCLGVPMHREDRVVGAIFVARTEPGRFSDNQIRLLKIFADQAAIAIGNVRLFEEVQERTRDLTESLEQQTATSEVLQVISSSQGELGPVFQTMLESATRVCGASFGTMNLWDGEKYNIVAVHNIPSAFAEYRQRAPIVPHPGSSLAIVVETHQAVQVPDLREFPGYKAGVPYVVGLADVAGARTILVVPMLKDDEVFGAITIIRQEVRQFTDKQVALVDNFTKQAVIAIENARLLKELRQRTDDLSQSLDDLRTAQDRLVQTEKLASLGQLTAGIAHEIKNPLNFVNNFSALTAELTDELNDLLKPAPLDDKMRGEADELTGMIKDNLQKVVQHGKRADSIVKNMLLHSREGSREHRPADINSLLDESLNLAYHGARAEKGEFNITLQRDFDADAGTIELFPQEITRAFLNLISNGVYAATKRKTEDKEPDFEPTLRASTKNLGSSVEIRIRDNGIGIPAGVQEKMFNPFFTTKPAGEGTGLGLSMTHDIIVKQHGGRIDVATEPGQFTEFIIVLPRMAAMGKAGADK